MTTDRSFSHPGVDVVARAMGDRLFQRRVDLRLTRPRLAALLGVTPAVLRAWEEGAARFDAKALSDLSHLLGLPMAHFVEGLDPPLRPPWLDTAIRTATGRHPPFQDLPDAEQAEIIRWLEETAGRGRR